ncbi:MAG: RNA methyltransferase [Ignavibacteriales bacterium]|nr:MAG: RNA methyltransferase [Ignavibacteriales bacterium]
MTEERLKKLTRVARTRQQSLHLVLENIHDPHNVSAILRSCDAAGVPKVSLIYNYEKFPRIGKKSSASAFKWVDREKFDTVEACYTTLRSQGFTILASSLNDTSKNFYDFDLTRKTAIVIGNEHRGISAEAEKLADSTVYIPMFGMIQSLNVSVSAAIMLYEAARQRMVKQMFERSDLSGQELEALIQEWSKR